MSDTQPPKESIVRRLRAFWKVLAVLLLVAVLTGAAVGQTTLTFYDDFEAGDTGDQPDGWDGGTIQDVSFNQFQSLYVDQPTSSQRPTWTDGPTLNNTDGEYQGLVRVDSNTEIILSDNPDGVGNTVQLLFSPSQDDSALIESETSGGVSNTELIDLPGDIDGEWWRFQVTMEETGIEATVWKASDSSPTLHNGSVVQTSTFDDGQLLVSASGDAYLDWIGSTGADARLSGTVRSGNNTVLPGVTITANQSGSVINTATTGPNGAYQMGLDNGTYNVTASKPGYFNQTREVNVSGDTVQDFTLVNRSQGLNLQVRPFLEHGQTVPYTVTASITNQTTGEEERMEVTDDAVVTSSNPAIVSVNGFNQEVTATSDTSINRRITLTAEYDHPDLQQTLLDTQNVTIANATVDNLKILPPVVRFTAPFSGGTDDNPNDKTILVLFVAVGAGVVASRWATSFAGGAATVMIVEMGWIAGFVGNGLAITTVFIGLFVLLNTAGNVDYTVRRG